VWLPAQIRYFHIRVYLCPSVVTQLLLAHVDLRIKFRSCRKDSKPAG
jgi:hypothetical protein